MGRLFGTDGVRGVANAELTPELVREFIQRIEIHERSGRYKKKHYTQQVDIYFNFIGQA